MAFGSELPRNDALVSFLLSQDGLLDAILAEHVDRRGWCPACPGPQSGRRRYPCDVRLIAERARRARDDLTPPPAR
ncbi:hypothetical protein AD006_27835 [Pseudonocardia sp. EC080610-09]|uniref:hypothetical protein n=1 Tax=unclassified Pseudonocardia TaxID=2619320 RepID=UPI0006CB5BB7|nr:MULTISPECIES: hypothetical protein [unclassified Pseudonocardia]ALE74727.1 hypothetical protein FRP1_20420 [Pseudonocardia sp. EC080625-04]ALL78159.1 hypothetical protein AD006_27835 [Pseudonocardia sp. EC080610-09]ALL81071.1 hypothetical protein AD017_07430 [Pseudonocardia sp. EC080619-01]